MDTTKLLSMWTAGERAEDIALEFGVSSSQIYRWRTVYRLPPREPMDNSPVPDPTPSEIEERKRQIRERNRLAMLREPEEITRARIARERGGDL
jgi:transposase-like protein